MNKGFKKGINIFLSLLLLLSIIIPLAQPVQAYSEEALKYINYYNLKTTNANGKPLNEKYLLNQMGMGERLVVYGDPFGDYKDGQWRYLGYDVIGNPFWNMKFPNDKLSNPSVAKNWIKQPWLIKTDSIKKTSDLYLRDPNYTTWLSSMLDTYNNPTNNWLASYNALTGKNWTATTLKDYAIMTQRPYDFSPVTSQCGIKVTLGNSAIKPPSFLLFKYSQETSLTMKKIQKVGFVNT